jgi:hypothetical protein
MPQVGKKGEKKIKYRRKFSDIINVKKLNFKYIAESFNWHFNNFKRKIIIGDKIVSYGKENRDKKFYVIGRDLKREGLFSIVGVNLGHIIFAIRHNFIPVIDMQNYQNIYLKEGALSKENSWEYYFEQPMGYGLEDIKNSRHIHLARSFRSPDYNSSIRQEILNDENRKVFLYLKEQFKKYIIFNKAALDYFSKKYKEIIGDKKNVLGVLCRGTDYVRSKPHGIPVQPDPSEVIQKAREILRTYQCSHIYLATEDQDAYELFRSNFGDILLTNDQYRYSPGDVKDGQWLADVKSARVNNNYHLGFEYLSSLNILSKCRYFIGGLNSGTLGVLLMSRGFEYHHVWNLGKYP